MQSKQARKINEENAVSVKFNEFEWRGIRHSSREPLARLVKNSIKTFFRFYPGEITVGLICFKAGPGGKREDLITVHSLTEEHGRNPSGVPVVLYTEGSQGLTALLNIEGVRDAAVKKILLAGPYNKRPAEPEPEPEQGEHQEASVQEVALPAASNSAGVSEVAVKVEEDKLYPERDAIDRELMQSGLPQHDLECLRAFYSELVDQHFGGVKTGYVFISNEVLTRIIESAFSMKPHFGGEFGSVYSSRIRPFAENRTQTGVKGWNFRVEKVLVFIEGALLSRMAQNHPHNLSVPPDGSAKGLTYEEIHDPMRAQPIGLDDKPVNLNVGMSLNGVAQQFLASYSAFMKAKTNAEEDFASATRERQAIADKIEELKAQLDLLDQQFKVAHSRVGFAQATLTQVVASSQLPPQMLDVLRALIDIQPKTP